jgi:choline dehydrogenase-like flavoprotein
MAACNNKPDEGELRSLGTFDYVIVGAGPSACGLLLGLLDEKNGAPTSSSSSSSSFTTVALLERGSGGEAEAADPSTRQLSHWFRASHRPSESNAILTGKVRNSRRRVVDVPTGRGLGGTSNINAGIVAPPARSDFARRWPAAVRDAAMGSVGRVVAALHGNGCITHSTAEPRTAPGVPIAAAAGHSGGSKFTTTPGGGIWKETAIPSLTTRVPCLAAESDDGTAARRRNYYEGLVAPLLRRRPELADRLTVATGWQAERLLFGDRTACVGVEAVSVASGALCTVRAAREVILCAGSLETPALLLASGIGRKADLEAAGIEAAAGLEDFPGRVGGHLRDHALLPRVMLTRPHTARTSLNGVRAVMAAAVVVSHPSARRHSDCSPLVQIGLLDSAAYADLVPHMVACCVRFYAKDDDGSARCKVRNAVYAGIFRFVRALLTALICYTPVYLLLRYCIACQAVFLMNPLSTGRVSVKKKKESVRGVPTRRSDLDVQIDLGYLSEERDLAAMMATFQAASEEKFYRNAGVEIFPGPLVRRWQRFAPDKGRNKWVCNLHPGRFKLFANSFVLPYFHWMGTCAMKSADKDDWVVDEDFRVRNVQGLRICDASVFPTLVTAPPAVTCAALGHILGMRLAEE